MHRSLNRDLGDGERTMVVMMKVDGFPFRRNKNG